MSDDFKGYHSKSEMRRHEIMKKPESVIIPKPTDRGSWPEKPSTDLPRTGEWSIDDIKAHVSPNDKKLWSDRAINKLLSAYTAKCEEVERTIDSLANSARDLRETLEARNALKEQLETTQFKIQDQAASLMNYKEMVRMNLEVIERLKGIEKDHMDDWKRIQNAERKCESHETAIKFAIEHLASMDNYSVVSGATHVLRQALK